ncbi:MAG: arylamine N-acetyltransferase [Corticimicrobacter sp.]|uniref:arylamine N-acetyltransferase family protein n=1 Tax=Corticimicrobacter sp. TaxID=2678536 RepID=UPI0032DB881E
MITDLETSILPAYFEKIGYIGTRAPTLDMLQRIHLLHPLALPFENLDPLLARPVSIDTEAVANKLLGPVRRGGYCFEHNGLLARVLELSGFRITRLAARVLWGMPDQAISPRSHMLLLAHLDVGDFVVDAGFGGGTLTAPLRLDTTDEQQTPHGLYRILRHDTDYLLQTRREGAWRPIYRFDLMPCLPVDYIATNYYLSSSPASVFCKMPFLAKVTPQGRYGLLGTQLSCRDTEGALIERMTLGSADEACQVLSDVFDVEVPDMASFAVVWQRVLNTVSD